MQPEKKFGSIFRRISILGKNCRKRGRRDLTVLIDTNVIIVFLLTRESFYKASAEVITKCAGKELDGYIAFHSISNLWYILQKVPEDKRRKWLTDIGQCLHVEGICHEDVIKAIKMAEFKDFEDCFQDRCAENIKAIHYHEKCKKF